MGQIKKRLFTVLLALGLWGVACLALPQVLQLVSERGADLVWRLVQTNQPERRVVLIDIDDESLSQIGPWPWARPVLSDLVRKLDAAGVSLKLFDITFPDQREGTSDFSRALSEGGQGSPSVLGQVFALRHESVLQVGEPVGALPVQGCMEAAMPAQGVIANARNLHPLAGHISPVIDLDGAVRKVPAVVCYAGRNFPALSVVGLTALAHQAPRIERGQGPWAPVWQLHLDALPGMPVALDKDGLMRVPFGQSRASFVSISASDILQNKAPVGLLKGAVVLVGASAFGLSDVVTTALGATVSGAEVHTQLLVGMLDGRIPHTPQAAWGLQWVGVAVLSLALMATLGTAKPLHQRRRVVLLPLVALAGAALLFLLHALLLWSLHIYVSWAEPALAVIVLGTLLGIEEHARSLHAKNRLYENLASYIPSRVAEKIALTVPSGEIEAQRSEVTILAADIRNFSAYCEARSPEDAARVLHRFYKTASEIIAAHGGVVEEMVGDSLLAVFDGPLPCPDHSRQALRAARQIWLRCGEELPNTSSQGLEPMAVGVGVESGTALLGSFGAANRRVHTVLGRTVTIALRLSELTGDLAYPILVGPGVATQIEPRLDEPDLLLKSLGFYLLPGLTQSGKIFTLCNLLVAHAEQEQQTIELLKLHNFSA